MSKEKLKNKNHGITLIALIITVIVLLILVGVTLSVTLGDNGLVNKAKDASEATEIAMDRELLLSAVVGTIDNNGEVNLGAIVLPEGFTGSNGTYTSKNGHTFNVGVDGTITYVGGEDTPEGPESLSEDLELLRTYFMGKLDETTGEREEINGFSLIKNPEVTENGDLSEVKFIDNEIIPTISKELVITDSIINDDGSSIYLYFQFRNKIYTMLIEPKTDTYAIVKSVDELTNTGIDLFGTYHCSYEEPFEIKNENEYIVIDGDERHEIEIIYYFMDNVNNIIQFTTNQWWNGCVVNDYQNTEIYNYILIYEGDTVINKILYDDYSIYWQNDNGIIADLSGVYVNAEGNRRLILNPEEKYILHERTRDGVNWSGAPFSFIGNQSLEYLKINGQYWVEGIGWNESFVQDENTLLIDGETFIKVNE